MIFANDLPNRTGLDIEIAREVPKKGDGSLDWAAVKKGKSGISVIAIWNARQIAPMFGMFDAARLPRVILTENWMAQQLQACAGLVTWNGAGFDLPVLRACAPPLFDAVDGKKNVDLMAIMALLKVGIDPERLSVGVPENWMNMAPRVGRAATSWINSGFGLDAVAKATLGDGCGKMEGFDGSMAIDAWQAGRYSEVASYCIGDTSLTMLLYNFAWTRGFLVSPSQGRVEIPRDVL